MRTLRLVPFRRCLVLVAIVLLLQHAAEARSPVGPKSRAAGPGATASKNDKCVLLTYEVGDLILNVPDYPYPSTPNSALPGGRSVHRTFGGGMGMGGMGMGMGGSGMGMFSVPAEAVPEEQNGPDEHSMVNDDVTDPDTISMKDLKRVLVTLVAPESWDEHGGEGALQQLGTSLVVRQTEAVHQQIEYLLGQLRKGSGKRKTVTIDARWLFLDSDDLQRLMPPDHQGPPKIDRQVLAGYTRRPSSIRGLTNCFTGQLVYLVSGTQRNVVSSFIPVVGSLDGPEQRGAHYASLKGGADYFFTAQSGLGDRDFPSSYLAQRQRAVGYQPVIQTSNFGVLLEIRPTLIPGNDRAIVDLRSTLTVPGEPLDPGLGRQPVSSPLTPTVDRVAIETHQLANTLSVPLGHPTLAGGLTYVAPSTVAPGQAAGPRERQPQQAPTETPQLYLVLELR